MKGPWFVVGALVVTSVGIATATSQVPFRATTDAVIVDVTVLNGTTPVPGLRAADFAVHDKGLPQEAVLLEANSVPLDLTLLLDVGGVNATGAQRYWHHIAGVPSLLRPGDRLGLTTVAGQVIVQFPLTPIAQVVPPQSVPAAGGPRLFDAMLAEIMRHSAHGRRRVVLVMTNGEDLLSVTAPRTVLELAPKSDGVFYCVVETRGVAQVHALVLDMCAATGGGRIRERVLADGVASLLKTLQTSYLLSYVPQGDTEQGWHETTVKVPGHPSYEIRHRRGYFRR